MSVVRSGSNNARMANNQSILPGRINTTAPRCYDTSGRYYLINDTVRFYVFGSVLSADNNILLSGEYQIVKPPYNDYGGFLMKTDTVGNVIWAKGYDSANSVVFDFISYYNILELNDGSILTAGITWNEAMQNDDVIISKMDNVGNLLWSRIFTSRLWQRFDGSGDYYWVQQMQQDPYTGDIFLTGPHWSDGRSVMKLDHTNGNILWSRIYQMGYNVNFDLPFGLDIRQNDLVSFGKLDGYLGIYRINKVNGDTLETKTIQLANAADWRKAFLNPEKVVKLNNGNYALSGSCYGYYEYPWDGISPLTHGAVMEIDPSLNFISAYCFKISAQSNSYNTKVTMFPDGSGLFTMLDVWSGYTGELYYTQFKNGKILKDRKWTFANHGMPYVNDAIRLPSGGDLDIKLIGDSINNRSPIEFKTLHVSDTSSDCLGRDFFGTFIEPVNYINGPAAYADSVGINDFSLSTQKLITTRNFDLYFLPACNQASFCDSFGMKIPVDTVCIGSPVIITARKNPECGSFVVFDYDSSVTQSFKRVTDSTFEVVFKSSWQGYIGGSVQGCTILEDSVSLTVMQSRGLVDLGSDKPLCPGNTILLNAKSGYIHYLWQNGSTDSTFLVTSPGTYHVKATDGCGNIFYDTAVITAAPPIPFDIGPDRTKCNNDTIRLTAPAGFLNYTWSNNYNIAPSTGQSVVVNPLVDTSYYVRAEKTPGCFAFDTIRIFVHHSPPILLGNDTSFCQGQNITFDAGPGFSSYLWSTGAASRTIVVNTSSNYSVVGTSVEGCKSFDTIRVLNVYANPAVNLDNNNKLCEGQSRILQAGNYNTYLWQDGSSANNYVVTDTGIYWVWVRDFHGCYGGDTVSVNVLLPIPEKFLPSDTAICSYSKFQVSSFSVYDQYRWSTNAISRSIIIDRPGSYWLRVTDDEGCIGTDSIFIGQKECMKGLFVPNAFTPAKNGHNDVFRALLFGPIKSFEFTIFNRWGQVVFRTTDNLKGWDGMLNGVPLESGSFVWTCKYQLGDEPIKLDKGTFVLIR